MCFTYFPLPISLDFITTLIFCKGTDYEAPPYTFSTVFSLFFLILISQDILPKFLYLRIHSLFDNILSTECYDYKLKQVLCSYYQQMHFFITHIKC